jgi:hypothetical protein
VSHSTLISRVRTVLLLQIVVPATLLFKLALETSALNNYFAWPNLAHSLQSASDQPPRLTCNSDTDHQAQPVSLERTPHLLCLVPHASRAAFSKQPPDFVDFPACLPPFHSALRASSPYPRTLPPVPATRFRADFVGYIARLGGRPAVWCLRSTRPRMLSRCEELMWGLWS